MHKVTFGLTAALALAATITLGIGGCSSSSSGGHGGAGGHGGGGGNPPASGGGGAGGGGIGGGGRPDTGGAPAGAGGKGTGGASVGGAGGSSAGGAAGGAGGAGTGGAGGNATGGTGAGGTSPAGTGGRATGGTNAGGAGSGGTTSLDAGYTGDGRGLDTGSNDVAPSGCSQLTTQSACDVRADCHSVFVVTGCELDAGHSCTQFGHCADGRTANCTGPALCKSLAPSCPAPYVVSYTDTCYEGCVSQSECPTPTCPQTAPSNGGSCGVVDYSCFYEDCTGAGRTQAKCTAGTWSVQTAACSTITCAGGGISTQSLTCAVGQVCVRTTGGGGAFVITPSCAANNCGTAPISTQCIQGASNCGLSSSLSGIIVNCNAPSSCGSGMGGCA